jgi:Inner membrane protein CreD
VGRDPAAHGRLLVVPFEHRWIEDNEKGRKVMKSEIRTLTILPTACAVQAHLEGEERFRGIFSVPVYRSVLDVSWTFAPPDLAGLRIDPALVDWRRSDPVVGIADVHAIQNRAVVRWNDVEHAFQSGAGCAIEAAASAPATAPGSSIASSPPSAIRAAPGSGWRSFARSPRRAAAASTSTPVPAARPSRWSCDARASVVRCRGRVDSIGGGD